MNREVFKLASSLGRNNLKFDFSRRNEKDKIEGMRR